MYLHRHKCDTKNARGNHAHTFQADDLFIVFCTYIPPVCYARSHCSPGINTKTKTATTTTTKQQQEQLRLPQTLS